MKKYFYTCRTVQTKKPVFTKETKISPNCVSARIIIPRRFGAETKISDTFVGKCLVNGNHNLVQVRVANLNEQRVTPKISLL